MGIRATIGDLDYEITSYSVSEDSTPTAVTDSTGSVGTVNFTIKRPSVEEQTRYTPSGFVNPGFEQVTGATVTTRTNRALEPTGAAPASQWTTAYPASGSDFIGPISVTDHPLGLTSAFRLSVKGGSENYLFYGKKSDLEVGEEYTLSFYYRSSSTEGLVDAWVVGSGHTLTSTRNWQRHHQTFIAPSATPGEALLEIFYMSSIYLEDPVGSLDVTGVLLEKTNEVRPYFDGDFNPSNDGGGTSWVSGASVLSYPVPVGATGAGSYRVTEEGKHWLHVPTGASATLALPTGEKSVSITAREPGQKISSTSTATSSTPNQSLTVSSNTLSATLSQGRWADPYVKSAGATPPTQHPILKYTEGWLEGQTVRLEDTRYGFTVGKVRSANYNADTQDIGVEVVPRTGEFNVYNVQAQPYVGTLAGAFVYYASLAGLTTDIAVDPEIADKPVTVPGFFGDLWANMKQFAAANECEIALVAGVIYLRRLRQQEVVKGKNFRRTRAIGGTQLAQAVEVYLYDTKPLNNELFYPSGGWTPEVQVLNVNAGETAEYTLEFDASIASFQEPEMVEWVDRHYTSSSVYSIAADDSLHVPPALWKARGGKVEFILNNDTTTMTVKLTGPEGIRLASGGNSRTFSLAMAADESGSRGSSLRIVGTGVGYTKTKHVFRTAVPPERTSTEVGVTIDNPFINDLETLYRTGSQAAKQFTGMNFEVTGIVSAVTDRGEGAAPTPTYGDIQEEFEGQTYSQVQSWYTSRGYNTYADVLAYWVSTMADLFSSQVFGRVQGARAWDRDTRRWFRIRQASITPENISFTMAEDDLTYGDMHNDRDTMTYGDVQQLADAGSLTYSQERMAGVYA